MDSLEAAQSHVALHDALSKRHAALGTQVVVTKTAIIERHRSVMG